jgi:hypothetical protein
MAVGELQGSSAASQYSPACGFGWRPGGRLHSQVPAGTSQLFEFSDSAGGGILRLGLVKGRNPR